MLSFAFLNAFSFCALSFFALLHKPRTHTLSTYLRMCENAESSPILHAAAILLPNQVRFSCNCNLVFTLPVCSQSTHLIGSLDSRSFMRVRTPNQVRFSCSCRLFCALPVCSQSTHSIVCSGVPVCIMDAQMLASRCHPSCRQQDWLCSTDADW